MSSRENRKLIAWSFKVIFVMKTRKDHGKEDRDSEKNISEQYTSEKPGVRLSKSTPGFSTNINMSDVPREDEVEQVWNKPDY